MSDPLAILAGWQEAVRAAPAAGRRFVIRGGGSKDFYGDAAAAGAALTSFDTTTYRGILSYEPTELVITVRAGTSLAEVEATLAAQGQMLACEPPHFGPGATIGGMVASGLSGPRRLAAGAVRDFVLGVRLLDGQGDVLNFGGQVMKNVAGYDVARLLTGSLGTLGVLLEVSLKVLPRPLADATLVLEVPQDKAIELMNRWGGQPLPVTATAWLDDLLYVRLAGAAAAVRAASSSLGGERLAAGEAFWTSLREQTHPFFAATHGGATEIAGSAAAVATPLAGGARQAGEVPLWRLALPTATPPLALPGGGCLEWGGGQRWLAADVDPHQLRELAARAGGHATLFRRGPVAAGVPAFAPLAPPLQAIHARLKAAFDPHGLFNPGRLGPHL